MWHGYWGKLTPTAVQRAVPTLFCYASRVPSKKSWEKGVQLYITMAGGVDQAENESDAAKTTVLMPCEKRYFCDQDLCDRSGCFDLVWEYFGGLMPFGSLLTPFIGIVTALNSVCTAGKEIGSWHADAPWLTALLAFEVKEISKINGFSIYCLLKLPRSSS